MELEGGTERIDLSSEGEWNMPVFSFNALKELFKGKSECELW